MLFSKDNSAYLAFTFLISLSALADTKASTSCGPLAAPITEAALPCLIDELIHEDFPELQDANAHKRIEIRGFNSNEYFFKVSIRSGLLSTDARRRHYSVDVNPKIFTQKKRPNSVPSILAVQGILAHELVHLVHLETGNLRDIAGIGLQEVFSPARYERATDRQAFERGHALGIKAFRFWVYENLSPPKLRRKRKRYYTPEEIDQWLLAHPS